MVRVNLTIKVNIVFTLLKYQTAWTLYSLSLVTLSLIDAKIEIWIY